ncbi:2-dehydro-3-deoxygalactonokinase [Thalassotalea sp. HSM 43]|uniref:2-dehydro-3-deoxygalactonokinase n=1 Tax=Thalassotalea sp. HSM 43 TaxID=2552945 RepID=UPI0010808E68|nr:2-dehydro-3-deoxygalactonokinase [Thalassotalea sp. HSM 43]QBY04235.1 2-dehydro-3-deoxygalactonokinase [Thalassotalea sp. HSM 43]
MIESQYLIAIDWGTSRLRAYLCSRNESEMQHVATLEGKGTQKCVGQFEQELFNVISPWLNEFGDMPIIMAGQIGSSIGWHEAQYMACPLTPQDIATGCLNFQSRDQDIYIVPGASCQFADGSFDVMRSEELQILGWLKANPQYQLGSHVLCLPGTHTKWVRIEDGQILYFRTAMTGELFDLLSNQSMLLEHEVTGESDEHFLLGIEQILHNPESSLTHELFLVRSKQLLHELSPQQAKSFLSGMLIGADIRAAQQDPLWQFSQLSDVHLIGAPELSEQFAKGLTLIDIQTSIMDAKQASLSGFASIERNIQ